MRKQSNDSSSSPLKLLDKYLPSYKSTVSHQNYPKINRELPTPTPAGASSSLDSIYLLNDHQINKHSNHITNLTVPLKQRGISLNSLNETDDNRKLLPIKPNLVQTKIKIFTDYPVRKVNCVSFPPNIEDLISYFLFSFSNSFGVVRSTTWCLCFHFALVLHRLVFTIVLRS